MDNLSDRDYKVIEKLYEHTVAVLEVSKSIHSAEEFRSRTLEFKATLFDLLQIGELAGNSLSREVAEQLSEIPWKSIYALRNRIVQGYAYVDYSIIWETITEDIPVLAEKLRAILQ